MCPACLSSFLTSLTSGAVIATSTGGVAAVVINKLRIKKPKAKENLNGK
jgi:hypothetical protein